MLEGRSVSGLEYPSPRDDESTSGRESTMSPGFSDGWSFYRRSFPKSGKTKLKSFLRSKLVFGSVKGLEEYEDNSIYFSESKTEPVMNIRSMISDDYLPRSQTFHPKYSSDVPFMGCLYPQTLSETDRLEFMLSQYGGESMRESYREPFEDVVKFSGCLPLAKWIKRRGKKPQPSVPDPGMAFMNTDKKESSESDLMSGDLMRVWGPSSSQHSRKNSESGGACSPSGVLEPCQSMKDSASGSDCETSTKATKVNWTVEKLADFSSVRSPYELPSPSTCEKLRQEIEEACNPYNVEAARIRIMRASYAAMDAQFKVNHINFDRVNLDPFLSFVERKYNSLQGIGRHRRERSVMTRFWGKRDSGAITPVVMFRRSASLPVDFRVPET